MERYNLAVYTTIIGSYDHLKHPMYFETIRSQADFFCFTDQSVSSDVFTIVPLKSQWGSPTRNSRHPKINTHLYLANYKYSIYLDANLLLVAQDLHRLIDEHLSSADIARFPHHRRNCLYDEAIACIAQNLDREDVIRNQVTRYKQDGFPRHFGLGANSLIIRRHTRAVEQFNSVWWSEYSQGSQRDQLSFEYARWKLDLNVSEIPYFWANNAICIRFDHNHQFDERKHWELQAVGAQTPLSLIVRFKALLKYFAPPFLVDLFRVVRNRCSQ